MILIFLIKNLFLLCSFIAFASSMKVDLNDASVHLNQIYPLGKFYFKNDSFGETPNKIGINMNFEVKVKGEALDSNSKLSLYLIKASSLDNLNHICCSNKGPIVCDYNDNRTLDSISEFKHEINIQSPQESIQVQKEYLSDNLNGGYGFVILHCEAKNEETSSVIPLINPNFNKFIVLHGNVEMFNRDSYLSQSKSLAIYAHFIYLFFYFGIAVYWVLLLSKFFFRKQQFPPCVKLFTFTLPLVIIEQMIKIMIFYQEKRTGETKISSYITLSLISLSKNLVTKVIFFLVSIGVTINLQMKLMKKSEGYFKTPQKKVILFTFLIFVYSLMFLLSDFYRAKNKRTNQYLIRYSFYTVASTMTNMLIWYGIYMRITKKSKNMKTIISIKSYFLRFNSFITLSFVLGAIFVLLRTFCNLVSGITFLKFLELLTLIMVDAMFVCLFSALVILLKSTPNAMKKMEDEYAYEMQHKEPTSSETSLNTLNI